MIVDASVAFKWIIDEPLSDEAEDLVAAHALVAPGILLAEVGHGVSKRIRRGEIAIEGLKVGLARLPFLVELESSEADLARAFELALLLHHSFYDCLYLALAERRNELLVTVDDRFLAKLAAHDFGTRATHLAELSI